METLFNGDFIPAIANIDYDMELFAKLAPDTAFIVPNINGFVNKIRFINGVELMHGCLHYGPRCAMCSRRTCHYTSYRCTTCKDIICYNCKIKSSCFAHHTIVHARNTKMTVCDSCGEDIPLFTPHYIEFDNLVTIDGDVDGVDICTQCFNDTNKTLIASLTGKVLDRTKLCLLTDDCEFGNIYSWIPIIQDSSGNEILVNLDKMNANNYGKFMIKYIDKDGYIGYHTLSRQHQHKILQEFKQLRNMKRILGRHGLEYEYNFSSSVHT